MCSCCCLSAPNCVSPGAASRSAPFHRCPRATRARTAPRPPFCCTTTCTRRDTQTRADFARAARTLQIKKEKKGDSPTCPRAHKRSQRSASSRRVTMMMMMMMERRRRKRGEEEATARPARRDATTMSLWVRIRTESRAESARAGSAVLPRLRVQHQQRRRHSSERRGARPRVCWPRASSGLSIRETREAEK